MHFVSWKKGNKLVSLKMSGAVIGLPPIRSALLLNSGESVCQLHGIWQYVSTNIPSFAKMRDNGDKVQLALFIRDIGKNNDME